jgi:hypothetical protein
MEKKAVDFLLAFLTSISIAEIILFGVTLNMQHLIAGLLFNCEFWLILIYEKIKVEES